MRYTLLALIFYSSLVRAAAVGTATAAAIKNNQPEKPIKILTRYTYKTNFADDKRPRFAQNQINLNADWEFKKNCSASLNTGLEYETNGTMIVQSRSWDKHFQQSDTTVSVNRSTSIFNNPLDISLENTFSTSLESQFEGVRSVPDIHLYLPLSFFESTYQMAHDVTYSYILNKYEFSPSSGERNLDHILNYEMLNTFRIASFWKAGVGLGIRNAHTMTGSWSLKPSTSAWTSLNWKMFSFRIKYFNADYRHPRDREDNLWYIDKTRRVLSLSAAINIVF